MLKGATLLIIVTSLFSGNLSSKYMAVDRVGLWHCIFNCKLSNEGDLILAEKMTAGRRIYEH